MKTFDELSPWEQMNYRVRLLCEVLGLSEAKIRHTYLGNDTPFDLGLLDRKRMAEEAEVAKLKKLKKKKGASVNELNKN